MSLSPELGPVAVVRRALAGLAGGLPRLFETAVEDLEREAWTSLGIIRERLERARDGHGYLTASKERARQAGLLVGLEALAEAEGLLRRVQEERRDLVKEPRLSAAMLREVMEFPPTLARIFEGRGIGLGEQKRAPCPSCGREVSLTFDHLVAVELELGRDDGKPGVVTLQGPCPCGVHVRLVTPFVWA